MKKDLITIVIPVYNVEKYIDRCVESIINQTYKNLEIILVDDGSSDNSPKICDEYEKKDKRIKVIHKENSGPSDARNIAIEKAKGKYISFVDSDDWLPKNSVEMLYKIILEKKVDIACGDIQEVFSKTTITQENDCQKINVFTNEEALEKLMYLQEFSNSASAKIYSLELFKNIRFPKGRYYEDLHTTYKVFAKAKKIAQIENVVYYYFQNDSSIMHKKFTSKRYEALESVTEEFEFIEKNFPNILDAAKFRIVYECIYILNDMPLFHKERKNIHGIMKKYRKNVLKDKKIYLKQRMMCLSTYLGQLGVKIAFKIRKMKKNR